MKPGYLTTEFLVTVLVVIAAVALCIADKIDGTAAMATIGAVSTGYSLSRGAAKINAPTEPTDPKGPVD